MRRHGGGSVGAVALALLLFVVLTRVQPAGPAVALVVSDLGQLLAAVTAALCCGWRARQPGERARSWTWLTAATGSWALGQAVWSFFELVAGRQTPFPSVADAGFLAFPVLAAIGLLVWPSEVLHGSRRWRLLLDGVLVAGALLILSWVTALGSIAQAEGTDLVGHAVSLGYPISDLVLLTLTVVVVAHARQTRSGLGLVALGLACLCLADSGFAYLTSVGTYATGSPVDAGWFGGFLLIAVAAARATRGPGTDPSGVPARMESTARALLPYLPAGLGLSVAWAGQFDGSGDPVALAAAAVVVAALLTRQLLAVWENRALVRQLLAAQQELHHQAFHDPLTGLANRVLFSDRLRHGLELHQRDLRTVSVLYCDLDGFKLVNDTLGHDAGDVVLRRAAERLDAAVRRGDTTARIGGDEFAILIEDGGDPREVAARVLASFREPVPVGEARVQVGVSIGIVELGPDEATPTAEVLLQRADQAMYRAKGLGRGTTATWTAQRVADSGPATPTEATAPGR